MLLFASFAVFLVYFANVAAGALLDRVVLGDVGEMLVLFAASILFVIAILKKEADRNAQRDGN